MIDEQHRFGVEQRQKLLAKSKHLPHLLAMTATPIPRSLALTVYGELDVSVLNELPANRKPIKTKLVSPISAKTIYGHIDQEIAAGRQVYVICSLINDNPEKYQVMQDFKDQKYDILVSTTVVEVGVDVPNATVMIIENADQFGLSQLHQLRGRVGRGEHQSYCYLMLSTTNKPSRRLQEIEKSNDGFYLAEVDMELRGPGEIYGKAQHGALNLQIATLADTQLIARAQHAAKQFIESDVDLVQYQDLNEQVRYYQRLTTLN